jgi:hypothetical protein
VVKPAESMMLGDLIRVIEGRRLCSSAEIEKLRTLNGFWRRAKRLRQDLKPIQQNEVADARQLAIDILKLASTKASYKS